MNKFVVVVFAHESKAYDAVRKLSALHQEGAISVYGTAVVQRDESGQLAIKQRSDEGPIGTGVGAMLGALTGALAGPAGLAVGMFTGGLAGSWGDYLRADLSDEFLEDLRRDLTPGKFAVVAEVAEEWVAPIDTEMERLGGTVVRERSEDFNDDVLEWRAAARKAELAERKAEFAGKITEHMESGLESKIQRAQQKLQANADKARQRLDDTKAEIEAKIRALEEQASRASPDVRGRVQQRIDDLRKDFEQREQKLQRAYQLSQEAFQP